MIVSNFNVAFFVFMSCFVARFGFAWSVNQPKEAPRVWLVAQHFLQPFKGPYNSCHQLSPFGLITPQDVGPSLGRKNLNSLTEKAKNSDASGFSIARGREELGTTGFFKRNFTYKKRQGLAVGWFFKRFRSFVCIHTFARFYPTLPAAAMRRGIAPADAHTPILYI